MTPMYWYSGSAWHETTNLYVYSGSAWQEVNTAYIRSGSTWEICFLSTQLYVLVSDQTYSTSNITCDGDVYTGGFVENILTAQLVDINQNPVTNTLSSNINVTIQFDTFYNNGCGIAGTTTYSVTIPTGSISGSTTYVLEQVAECGFGCATEGVSNPCVLSINNSILLHPSSSIIQC